MKRKTRILTTTGKVVVGIIIIVLTSATVNAINYYKEVKLDQEFFKTLDDFNPETLK